MEKTAQECLDELKKFISYDKDTGFFTWIASGRGIRTGKIAGSVDPNCGYRIIRIRKHDYYAQRLAWLFNYGVWPRLIRFQNGNKDDCRIENLCEGFYLETKYDHRTKEGKAAYGRAYRAGKEAEIIDSYRLRKFGISGDEYRAMNQAQGGVCFICGNPETAVRGGRVLSLAVDHCHNKGHVRKLLCGACNKGLGNFRDNPDYLRKAAEYLELHCEEVTA